MKHSIVIPVMGRPHELKGVVSQIFAMATGDYEAIIIDNTIDISERSAWRDFVVKYLSKIADIKYIDNNGNKGMIETLNQIYQVSTGDIISILHSDLFILESGWDEKVVSMFENDNKLGLTGFFGQRGITHDGGRIDTLSNMLEAEIHGRRSHSSEYIVTVDGFSIIVRREMLDKMGGFDTDYIFHHQYDKNIGLDCYNQGYTAKLCPVLVHHWNGMSANQPDYQNWVSEKMGVESGGDLLTHRKNAEILNKKWGHCMPLMVDGNGNLNRLISKNDLD